MHSNCLLLGIIEREGGRERRRDIRREGRDREKMRENEEWESKMQKKRMAEKEPYL